MPHDAAEAATLVERARRLQSAQGGQEPLNQELLKKLAYTAAGELSPMAAIIGGCVGQEARPCSRTGRRLGSRTLPAGNVGVDAQRVVCLCSPTSARG